MSKLDEWASLSPAILNPSSSLKAAVEKAAVLVAPGENYALYPYFKLLPYLLMAGTVIFIAIIIVQNYRLNRRIFKACRLADDKEVLATFSKCKRELGIRKEMPVYVSAYINTPFISGIFRPCIVLPNIALQAEELRYIFLHELTHWKNCDAWLKSLMLLINVIHWFNPLAYLARRNINHWEEAFCDESVTRSMNQEEKRRYCELILSLLWYVAEPNNVCSSFSDKRDIEKRLSMIMKAENSKKWVRVFAVALTLVLAVTGTYAATAGGTEGAVNFSAPISVKEVPQKMMPGSVLIYDSQLQPKVIKGGYIENETQPNPETEDSRKGSILKYLRPVSITDDMSADEKKLAEWENRLVSDFRKQILSKPLPPKTPFQPTIYPGMKVVYNEITGDINNIYYLDPDAEDPSGYSLHNIPAAGN